MMINNDHFEADFIVFALAKLNEDLQDRTVLTESQVEPKLRYMEFSEAVKENDVRINHMLSLDDNFTGLQGQLESIYLETFNRLIATTDYLCNVV